MPVAKRLKINRFTVMAVLQAARARRLGLSQESAFSWGLNRAIFYAAAKKGFRGGAPTGQPGEGAPPKEAENTFFLGRDMAYRDPASPRLVFTIGGENQTEDQFRRKIASRFGSEEHFLSAWNEALGIIGEFDEEILGSGPGFYSDVYKPRRDALVAEWAARFGTKTEP